MSDPRRALPSVGALFESDALRPLIDRTPRGLVKLALRHVIEQVRRNAAPAPADAAGWAAAVELEVARRSRLSLQPLYNATGVVLHTNLGRAPLARSAIDAIARTAAAGTNLEYDVVGGSRGSRSVHCAALLRELTGAEDALVVNNGAAALVLVLNTLANGREAIVSRGELIEIGGSFRVPEIMTKSGAVLLEVGTTNRTHADDYRRALCAATAAIVKVHRSNFEVRGFVAEASLRDLAPVARDGQVPLLFDLGSGLLTSLDAFGLPGEPTAADAIADGASVVVMSGDKLLGGPQAGIIVGQRDAVAACQRNPLARALRVDKLTLAALEATLALYRDPPRARREIPALAMLTAAAGEVHAQGRGARARLARRRGALRCRRHRRDRRRRRLPVGAHPVIRGVAGGRRGDPRGGGARRQRSCHRPHRR